MTSSSLFSTTTPLTGQNTMNLNFILIKLIDNKLSLVFRAPVDYEGLGLVDYPEIIKKPMDLGTVKEKLQNGLYKTVQKCLDDIQTIWENSKLYNEGNQWIEKLTIKCQSLFHKAVMNYLPEVNFKSEKGKNRTRNRIQTKAEVLAKTSKDSSKKAKKALKNKGFKDDEKTVKGPDTSDEESSPEQKILYQRISEALKQAQTKEKQRIKEMRQTFLDLANKSTFQKSCLLYMFVKERNKAAISSDQFGTFLQFMQRELNHRYRLFKLTDDQKYDSFIASRYHSRKKPFKERKKDKKA